MTHKQLDSEFIADATQALTGQEWTEHALRASEAKFRTLFDATSDAVLLIDATGIILGANKRAKAIFGYERKEIVGKSLGTLAFLKPDDSRRIMEFFRQVIAGGQIVGSLDIQAFHKRGDVIALEVGVFFAEMGTQQCGAIGIMRDVTKYKQAECRLQESEKRYLAMMESIPQCICEIDENGSISYVNSSGLQMYGYSQQDIDNGLSVFEVISDEDHDRLFQQMTTVLQGQQIEQTEFTSVRKDGTAFSVRVYPSPILENGETKGIRAIVVDMTSQQRLYEEEVRTKILKEADQAKTQLLANVSHELRTPLTHIRGLASTLVQPDVIWDEPTQKEFLDEIISAADRVTRIVADLVDISGIDAGVLKLEMVPTKISTIANQIQSQLDLLTQNHHFVAQVSSDLPRLYGDEVRIGQVITNLVANAAAYSEAGTEILLTASQAGNSIVVSVVDQGIGIPPEELDSIFDSFRRCDGGMAVKRNGLGLGLAICKTIIHALHGSLWVESDPGKGSTFNFSLPVINEKLS